MSLPECLTVDRWTERTARRIFPLLVWCAEHEEVITYKQLDEELQRRGWGHHVLELQYGRAAGALADALAETAAELETRIPPLNALVVNARSRVPGKGCDYYLQTFCGGRSTSSRLEPSQRKVLAEEAICQGQSKNRPVRRRKTRPVGVGEAAQKRTGF
jgi:hypothetical protein